ncbi:MAG: DUF3025 domain-containing protein [Gammaproteobacteria bacterium]|nr:DUF3025 domain-containing protein [Gammaproteobacteria bacterium]
MIDTKHDWTPDFLSACPKLFAPITSVAALLTAAHRTHWPTLTDYQTLLDHYGQAPHTASGAAIRFVAQGARPSSLADHYEPRIFLRGEVQTRTDNWHDLFQVLIWTLFPQTKLILNALHYHAAHQRHQIDLANTRRTPLENALTLFDECGAMILSSDPALLQLIRDFRWKELFWHRRRDVQTQLRCIVFGHALYEKALTPYPGMTAQALLFDVDEQRITAPIDEQIALSDALARQFLDDRQHTLTPRRLQPFPLLGMPGWTVDNHEASYYDDTRHFRPGRTLKP